MTTVTDAAQRPPSENPFFGMSDEELIQTTLGDIDMAFAEATANTPSKRKVEGTTNTTNFDWRKEMDCIGKIRDQGSCGSCWSFGTTEFLTDRFELANDCQFKEVLSPQYMVSCWDGDFGFSGCHGAITL